MPPSLVNIFKEIERDLGQSPPTHGNLEHWATQGVLLLNATLTVAQGQPGSHQQKGWERLTDAVIRAVSSEKQYVVFMLWGAYAQKKGSVIDQKHHLVLQTSHPSPFSFHRGFYGSGHFGQANTYLTSHGKKPIHW